MTLNELIEQMRASLKSKLDERQGFTDGIAEVRASLTDDAAELSEEQLRKVQDLDTKRRALDEAIEAQQARIDEMVREDARDQAAAAARAQIASRVATTSVRSEANPVYRRGDSSASYFRDLFNVTRGDRGAQERLVQSQERAATTGATAGGTFAPPAWLVSDFVALARAGRVTADLMNGQALPSGVSSVNLPKITVGAGVGVTQTQNTTIAESGITTTSVSSGISTISGKQTVSIELIRQSGTPFDQVILQDLAQEYAVQLDMQVLAGSGSNGQLKGIGQVATAVAFTTTTPAVVSTTVANSFYSKVLGAKNGIETTRLMPATAIVMHPRRWNWILAAMDTTNRPLVTPSDVPSINSVANASNGFSGHSLAGLPVYLDANIATTTGAATNQDTVYVLRTDDLWLWESSAELASFDATAADQNSILFRVLGFAAFIGNRYDYAAAAIDGTGLVTPTF